MKKIAILFSVLVTTMCAAQQEAKIEILTLEQCINAALDKNLNIQQAQNNELIAYSNQFQSLINYLPSLAASANYDYFFGTTFDVNAARQVTATTNSSSPRVTANLILFNGLSRNATRSQRQNTYIAAKENVENVKLTTEANILQFYLNVLLSQENIRISSERVELLEAQLERAKKRESVGVGNLEEVFNFQSQLATEKLNLQTLNNGYQSNLLTLLQSMRLDVTAADYSVESITVPDEELLIETEPFGDVLASIMAVSPALKSSNASMVAAKYQVRAAKGQVLPTLSVFGMVGSNYSSNGAVNPKKPYYNPDTGEGGFNFEPNADFFTQLGYNEFEYVNLSINIPIFNRLAGSNNIQVAKLNMANAELANEQAIQNITNGVQQVYLDLVAAKQTYISAQENLEALNQSFEFMEKRYETGNTDFYTYLESLNNKNRAEVQLINAKYSTILRTKILNIYRGL